MWAREIDASAHATGYEKSSVRTHLGLWWAGCASNRACGALCLRARHSDPYLQHYSMAIIFTAAIDSQSAKRLTVVIILHKGSQEISLSRAVANYTAAAGI